MWRLDLEPRGDLYLCPRTSVSSLGKREVALSSAHASWEHPVCAESSHLFVRRASGLRMNRRGKGPYRRCN